MKSSYRALTLVLPALSLLASCQTGLGSVPTSLVELYDQAKPDGVIELEIGRDGRIREMEAEVPISALPAAVREAALAKAPGATVTGAERELTRDGAAWEVKLQHEGRGWEFVVSEAGDVIETEKELRQGEAPAAVLAGADRELAGGTLKSVEVIEHGDHVEYHVKKEIDGASFKIVLLPDGGLVRKVREARAEIEVPLR